MTAKPAPMPDAPEAEAPVMRTPRVGDVVLYSPPAHMARHVAGPWAAIVLNIDPQGACVLAVMPPSPVPVGNDPMARIEAVTYSEALADGCWSWRKHVPEVSV